MASADQLKALLKSHIEGDDDRFLSIAMQVAAREARQGHGRLAEDLRALIDSAKSRRTIEDGAGNVVPITRPRGELAHLLVASYPKLRLPNMVLDGPVRSALQRVITEQMHFDAICGHGLSPRRKLLLIGPPGTGKTMTASVLAGELGLPLLRVRLDALITKFMGETAAKLRQVFDAVAETRGVYFFDEFDAIGSQRGLDGDVGEIRRVLNSFLQMIEEDTSNSLVIAATNHAQALDQALFRRFDDVIRYGLPSGAQCAEALRMRLAAFRHSIAQEWPTLGDRAVGMSYAEVARAGDEAMKDAIVDGRESLSASDVERALAEGRRMSCITE